MKKGITSRKVVWETANGKQLEITIERSASFMDKHIALIRYQVLPLNFSDRSNWFLH